MNRGLYTGPKGLEFQDEEFGDHPAVMESCRHITAVSWSPGTQLLELRVDI